MYSKTKWALICFILVLFNMAVVCASDVNSTGLGINQVDDSIAIDNTNLNELNAVNDVEISSSQNDSNLKESNDDVLNKNLNDDIYSDSIGKEKLDTTFTAVSTKVVKGSYFQVYLKDSNNNVIKNANVVFTLGNKNFNAVTDSKGIASLQISKNIGNYSVKATFKGDSKYNSVSKTFKLVVPMKTSILIGNDKLLTNGYLKIYLQSYYAAALPGKTLIITVGDKKFTKKTNSEGVVVVKPQLSTETYLVTVTFAGTSDTAESSASKNVTGVEGNARSPFTSKVPSKNGMPDLDYMPAKYVMANDDAKYTLLKIQYRAVLKRDSQCLFLNNKLTKYVLFKTKAEPTYTHMITREKWNVIERALNTKIVLKNKYNYWPVQITVNLKGKSYTYSEVRDVQDTGYTCGPTSSSMCSQVLRNYVNEWHLSVNSGTTYSDGSSTSGLKRGLEKFNMKCTVYYKSSFYSKAIKELKKGGCALIFHTWGHYVAVLDISSDGKKVLVGNPSGDYDHGSHNIPTNWMTVDYLYNQFNDYDTSGLIVKLNYNLSKATKTTINNLYSNLGSWSRGNTNERIPQI
ncbi:cysteine peptidase family C39 domain-containing protein [Methanobrevibacter sp. UBA188]|uniref:cysteine peptidase family C39 domain-containing protein n=1 Tax=unclassified Methanobrevibacter TaxID=2638681 RepID=UPI0025D25FD3|nr:cysteine peptidase family C39 domain-containing protein [Methanobrevibacter sp. UBA188]